MNRVVDGISARVCARTCVVYGILSALPLVGLVVLLVGYHLDVPVQDQWEFTLFLGKAFDGTLSAHDFWTQHNEHRLLFPRVILLGLAALSRWNITWELAANVVLALGTFAVIVRAIKTTARRLGVRNICVLTPVVSLIVFSPSQWQNWFWGWQLQEFLNVLSAIAGLVLLTDARRLRRHFWAAVALGIIATYSFANGVAYWAVGALGLLLMPDESSARFRFRLGLWLLAATVAVGLFFCGYHHIEYHPAPWGIFEFAFGYVRYTLTFLGSPVVSYSSVGATLAGAAGLGLFVGLSAWLIRARGRSNRVPLEALAPWLCVGAYAVAGALVTAVGRLAFGVEQAMSSRYVTLADPLWLAMLALAFLASAIRFRAQGARVKRRFLVGLTAVFVALLSVNAAYGAYKWTERYHYEVPARDALLTGDDPELLGRLHPDPNVVLERRPILQKHHLSVFRR